MSSDAAPSIEQLRHKFFGTDVSDTSGAVFRSVDDSVVTVRVAPEEGGPAKTADYKDGKVTIVQG